MIDQLKETLSNLEIEMDKVSKELFSKVADSKLRAVKRLSLKLHEVSSEIIKTKEEIDSLELQAMTKVINEGNYTISIVDENQAVIEKTDGTLSLNYIYMKEQLVGNLVYSCFKRSSGTVNDTEIYELDLRWARYKGSIAKHSRAEIALAEEVLAKYISFVGGAQIV